MENFCQQEISVEPAGLTTGQSKAPRIFWSPLALKAKLVAPVRIELTTSAGRDGPKMNYLLFYDAKATFSVLENFARKISVRRCGPNPPYSWPDGTRDEKRD